MADSNKTLDKLIKKLEKCNNCENALLIYVYQRNEDGKRELKGHFDKCKVNNFDKEITYCSKYKPKRNI